MAAADRYRELVLPIKLLIRPIEVERHILEHAELSRPDAGDRAEIGALAPERPTAECELNCSLLRLECITCAGNPH